MKTATPGTRRWRRIGLGAVLLAASLSLAYVLVERARLPEECAATEGLGPVREIVRSGLRDIDKERQALEADVFTVLDKKAAEKGWAKEYEWELYGRVVHSPRYVELYKEKQYVLSGLMAIESSGAADPRTTCINVLRSQEFLSRYKEAFEREHAIMLEVIHRE